MGISKVLMFPLKPFFILGSLFLSLTSHDVVRGQSFDLTNQEGNAAIATLTSNFPTGDTGDATATGDASGIKLTGQVRKVFSLDSDANVEVNKFTTVEFKLLAEEPAAAKGLCLYHQKEEEEFEDLKIKCFIINGEENLVLPPNVEKITGDLTSNRESRVNLALDKTATQSSTYKGDATKAIDGNTTSQFDPLNLDKNTVSHTKFELSPFWEVDLGGDFVMNEILIYKRMDPYNGRLKNFNVTVYDSNGIEIFKELYDTLSNEASIAVNTGGITGKVVRIQLNDEGVERVLCLAEVMVFGNSFHYNTAIGKLLRMPPTDINRLALIQQNRGTKTAVSILSDFQFAAGDEENFISWEWKQNSIGVSDYVINIQGTGFITRSEGESKKDGVQFIAVKDPISKNKILTYTGGSKIVPHEDPFEEVINFAISDDGLMVASFKKNSASAVRILQVGDNAISKKDELIGGSGYGEGVAITPDGSTVAIGNPLTREVFILSLDRGIINTSESTRITPPTDIENVNDRFGDKIGLSSSGNSIAIAAPSSNGGPDKNVLNAGTIYISTLNQRSGIWEPNTVVLYGVNKGRMLGGGGVAIIDNNHVGRVDVNDSLGDLLSFNFDVKCSDPNAIPIGKNQNIFDARCECGKNYKSTSSFQGKVLRDNIDVCVKCEEKEGTGDCVRGADGPTASPTSQPSMLKITPSPSAEPSINKSPSDSPSIVPSMTLGSLFDGQNCHYDGECQTGTCSGSVCEPGVLSISTINANGDEVNVDLSLVTPVSIAGGGVLALDSTIDLNEKVKVTYTLETPIIISKLTFIEAQVTNIEEAIGLKICPSEKVSTSLSCGELPFKKITSEDKIRFSATTLLTRFITFEQMSGRSRISNIKLVTYQKGVIDDDGECVDDNAQVDASQGQIECICKPSFVVWESLNEDKALKNVLDFCRSCADTEKCSYDGGVCEDGKYSCYDNNCDNGKCTPKDLLMQNADGNTIKASFYVANDTSITDGGVHVTGPIISLFGNSRQIYELDEAISVNKWTDLVFAYVHPTETDSLLVSLCLYQTKHDAEHLFGNSCMELTDSVSLLHIGKDMFGSRSAFVKYIGFSLSTTNEPTREVSAKLENIKFNKAPEEDIIKNGACVDENAKLFQGDKCICKLGFVASNGGRILSNIDDCVRCTEPCSFDGDSCTDDWDCYSGSCSEKKICTPRSFQMFSKKIGAQDTPVEANLLLSASDVSSTGGIVVEDSGELTIFGNVTKYFKLLDPVDINRFTMIDIDVTNFKNDQSIKFSICLYDTYASLDCPESCVEIDTDEEDPFYIAELIAHRDGKLEAIALRQQQGEVDEGITIRSIRILEKQTEQTPSGTPCGENAFAVTVQIDGNYETKCKCSDGYMSTDISTKSKLLREQDKCVNCIGSSKCYLSGREGESCANDLITDMFLGGLKSEPQRLYAKLIGSYPPSDSNVYPDFPKTVKGQGGTLTSVRKFETPGGENLSFGTVTLNGIVSSLFQLQTKYTVDKFSSIFFEASLSPTAGIAVCLDGDINVHNSTNILCINLNGDEHDWSNVNYPQISSSIATGKLATTDSSIEPDSLPSHATDGNKNDGPIFRTLPQDFPWWEVDLEREFEIGRIDIHLEEDASIDTLADYNVGVYDSTGKLVYDYYGKKVSGDGADLFYKKIDGLPQNTRGNRVRITMNDENRILALREVEVFESDQGGKRLFEIPIGRLREGMEIEHVAFIQHTAETSGNGPIVSNLQNFNFVYGSFEAITQSPSISPAPSISMLPTPNPSSLPSSFPSMNSTQELLNSTSIRS